MGKKQRLKKAKSEGNGKKTMPAKKASWSAWIVGITVFFALTIAGIVVLVQTNKARFIKISVAATTQTLQNDLAKSGGRFTMEERERLERVLNSTNAVAQTGKQLDPALGGHLMFILKVCDEIIRQGSLAPGELDKLDQLLAEGLRRMPANQKPE